MTVIAALKPLTDDVNQLHHEYLCTCAYVPSSVCAEITLIWFGPGTQRTRAQVRMPTWREGKGVTSWLLRSVRPRSRQRERFGTG
jgi:hypothetical protein